MISEMIGGDDEIKGGRCEDISGDEIKGGKV